MASKCPTCGQQWPDWIRKGAPPPATLVDRLNPILHKALPELPDWGPATVEGWARRENDDLAQRYADPARFWDNSSNSAVIIRQLAVARAMQDWMGRQIEASPSLARRAASDSAYVVLRDYARNISDLLNSLYAD